MANTMLRGNEEVEARTVWLSERPIDFETFLNSNFSNDMELRNGVMVKKMAAQLEHEWLFVWLLTLFNLYIKRKNLGIVLGSRTTVQIDRFHSRMPDLLFVREANRAIVQQRAVYGTPDLVIELVSPGDRASDLVELETDYDKIGVPEIVFIDQQKRRVRLLHRRNDIYEETILTAGDLVFATVPGFVLQVEWLFADPRPDELDILNALLAA